MQRRDCIKTTPLAAMAPSLCIQSCGAEWLSIAARLVDECPDTSFVHNHCGTADPVAFFPADKQPRAPEHDRVIFAGNWPVVLRNMPLANWIKTLEEVVAVSPIEEQHKVFHKHAEIFYELF